MLFYKLCLTSNHGNSLDTILQIIKNFTKNNQKIEFKLPNNLKRFVVLKSPHIYKKAMEHFESNVSSRVVYLTCSSLNEINFLNKLKLISWSFLGVSLKIVRFQKKRIFLKQKDSNL